MNKEIIYRYTCPICGYIIIKSANSEEVTECPSCLDGKLTGTAWTNYVKEDKATGTFADWLKTVGGISC